MPRTQQVELKPRKTPVQQRSTASVEAIRQAALQVLLAAGKEKLTTTLVAHRAGVSVGTLYQYFPNKNSLLQDVLRAHLDEIYASIEHACASSHGLPLAQMAQRLIRAFLAAKLQHPPTSRALYRISDDLGGATIARTNAERGTRAIAAMLRTAPEPLAADPATIALVAFSSMAGVSRRMVESSRLTAQETNLICEELVLLITAYLQERTAQ